MAGALLAEADWRWIFLINLPIGIVSLVLVPRMIRDVRDPAAVAARMLEMLGARSVRLLTNNPAKVAALEEAGVDVAERVPHQLPENPHNARYLATKRDRAGHLLR